ncbi:MAG: hypothetical protein QW525_00900 [Thermoplasmatales archaeon]
MNRWIYILTVISLFFLDILIFFGAWSNLIIYSSDSSFLLLLSSIAINAVIIFPILVRKELIEFYTLSYLLFYEFALSLLAQNAFLTLFVIPSACAASLALFRMEIKHKTTRFISFMLVLAFMFFISKSILLVTQPVPAPLTVELLADRMSAIGEQIPITEFAGLFLSTKSADIIISPFQFFLYLITSVLLVENYHLIVPLLNKNKKVSGLASAGYSALSALGCQCESAIGIFPAASLLILNSLLLPFFGLSVALLFATYLLVSRFYARSRIPRIRFSRSSKFVFPIFAVWLIGGQIAEVLGVAFGLERNPIFLFGMMMLMILDGFVFYYLIKGFLRSFRLSPAISIFLLIFALLLVIIWFIPPLTASTMNNPLVFSLMSYLSLLSGFIVSLASYSKTSIAGITFLEGYVVALGIIPVILFYLIFYMQKNIWPFWTFSQQTELSMVLWISMIPFMWLATQSSLVSAVFKA